MQAIVGRGEETYKRFEFQAPVLDAAQLPGEFEARKFASIAAQAVGLVAVSREAKVSEELQYTDLLEALTAAESGEEQAQQLIHRNVVTNFWEIMLKHSSETTNPLVIGKDGDLYQFGQSLKQVHINAFLWASNNEVLRSRGLAEARNSERLAYAQKNGLLETNYFFVVSLCDDTAKNDIELQDSGFYAETKSASLQFTTQTSENELSMTTSFVAGVKSKDAERHDHRAVAAAVYELSDGLIDWRGRTALEILDSPILIPKSLLPNGAIDFVKLYDKYVGEDVFYGHKQVKQDYEMQRQENYARMNGYKELAWSVAQTLISEAQSFKSPADAAKRLHRLAERALSKKAVFDHTIDYRVFGIAAEQDIILGRHEFEMGNFAAAERHGDNAADNAKSVGCPTALRNSQENQSFGDGKSGDDAGESKVSWKWKMGTCRVKSCQKSPTEVGPCDVCRSCQHMFDKGLDPTLRPSAKKKEAVQLNPGSTFEMLIKEITRPKVKDAAKKSDFALAA